MSDDHAEAQPLGKSGPEADHSHHVRQLQAEIRSRLQRSGHRGLDDVSCDFSRGVLTLRGRVETYYLKQLAQAVLCGLDGVEELTNDIHVDAPPRRG